MFLFTSAFGGSNLGSGGGGGGLWQPSELGSALRCWLRGGDLSGSNGDPVATWPDATANANDATQATSTKRPTLDTTGLNGLNVVDFNPTTVEQWLQLPDGFSGQTEGAIFIVAKNDQDPPNAATDGALVKFGTSGENSHTPWSNGTIYDDFGTSSRKTVGDPPPSLASWYIISFHSQPGLWRCYINGILVYSTTTNPVAFRTIPLIGNTSTSETQAWRGKIAEICVVDAFLSVADRQNFEGYLAHEFAITSILDVDHPHKSSPPIVSESVDFLHVDSAASSSFGGTFSGVNFGVEDASRKILIAFARTGNGQTTITGVTIGGVTATRVAQGTEGGGTRPLTEMWIADVPTGASGNVVISGASERVRMAVYRIVGLNSDTPTDTFYDNSSPTTGPVTVDAGGFAVAVAGKRSSSGTFAMTGITVNTSGQNGGTASGLRCFIGSDQVDGVVTPDVTGDAHVLLVAAFR